MFNGSVEGGIRNVKYFKYLLTAFNSLSVSEVRRGAHSAPQSQNGVPVIPLVYKYLC